MKAYSAVLSVVSLLLSILVCVMINQKAQIGAITFVFILMTLSCILSVYVYTKQPKE